MHARLVLLTVVAALAASGPAVAEQRPIAKPPAATAKPVIGTDDGKQESRKGGPSSHHDQWHEGPLGVKKGGAKPGTK